MRKRAAIGKRRRTNDPREVLAHDGRGSKPGLCRDSLDVEAGRFEQPLRVADARASDPMSRRRPNLRPELPARASRRARTGTRGTADFHASWPVELT